MRGKHAMVTHVNPCWFGRPPTPGTLPKNCTRGVLPTVQTNNSYLQCSGTVFGSAPRHMRPPKTRLKKGGRERGLFLRGFESRMSGDGCNPSSTGLIECG